MGWLIRLLRRVFVDDQPTAYGVTRDGKLFLDWKALAKDRRMKRQFDAARELRRKGER